MQVEAPAPAGTVQRFAHKVKAGAALELEMRVHLAEAEAAAGSLGLFPAAGGQARKAPVLGGVGQLGEGGRRQGGKGTLRQLGRSPEGPAQLDGQQAHPEIGGGIPGKQGGPGRKLGGKGRFLCSREEVQLHGGALWPPARGQQAGQLHDADAGKPVVGKLHFARLLGQDAGVCV